MKNIHLMTCLFFFCLPSWATNIPQLDCIINPHKVIAIGSSEDAVVKKVNVDKGDFIKKDQVLIELDDSVEKSIVELAQSKAQMKHSINRKLGNLSYIERKFQRILQAHRSNAISMEEKDLAATELLLAKHEWLEAQDNLKIAELELIKAKNVLQRRSIKSPIDGVVIDTFVSAGEVSDNKELLKIAKINPLTIDVIVPAKYFGQLNKGMVGKIYPETKEGKAHIAHVEVVDKLIDGSSGTFDVRLTLPNSEYKLPSGLNCRVDFIDINSMPSKKTLNNFNSTYQLLSSLLIQTNLMSFFEHDNTLTSPRGIGAIGMDLVVEGVLDIVV